MLNAMLEYCDKACTNVEKSILKAMLIDLKYRVLPSARSLPKLPSEPARPLPVIDASEFVTVDDPELLSNF
jgi:hypothetical protein